MGKWRSEFRSFAKRRATTLFHQGRVHNATDQEIYSIFIPSYILSCLDPLCCDRGGVIVGIEDFTFQGGSRTSFPFMNRLIGALICTITHRLPIEKVILIPNRKWEVAFFGGGKKMDSKQRKLIQCAKLGVDIGLFNEHQLDAMCMAQWLTTQIKFGRL